MKKLLILITAYNVENFIKKVINRIPHNELKKKFDYQILIIDDKSKDRTKEEIRKIKNEFNDLDIKCLFNKINQGYGGNQKIGYHYAIKFNFDYVVLLHGDGQYAPEKILEMLDPFEKFGVDAVQGSRMIKKFDALKGRMPIYKIIGNVSLTFVQNILTGLNLSEFHSGYRAYRVKSIKELPFQINSNHFHFDTEIFIQLKIAKKKIYELPIPTFYGKETSSLNTIQYGFAILNTTFKYFIQKFSIFYERKYDIKNFDIDLNSNNNKEKTNYVSKLSFLSTHSMSFSEIPNNSRVLSLGCGDAYVENKLKDEKNCYVVGFDNYLSNGMKKLNDHKVVDLNNLILDIDPNKFDFILCLDVIEHIVNPELFLKNLYEKISLNLNLELIISTPNVANIVIRIMLLFGNFNYGRRGILDRTHTRLFTKKTFYNILYESNFKIISQKYVPIPLPLVIKNKLISDIAMKILKFLNIFFGKLFSFQFIFKVKPRPSLDYLLLSGNSDENI